jgi:membrane associated rhomboid family serine protease
LDKAQDKQKPLNQANGIFLIILINLAIFIAQHFYQVRGIKSMYLSSDFPVWYQFVTATFCHANWNHLSSNLFLLYIFGKIVEEEKGNFGLWLSYLFTGVGANMVSWFTLPPNSFFSGASGAVFGLFVISVLVKMSRGWSKFLEVLILGQFVMKRVSEAVQTSTGLLETKFCGFIFGGNEFLTIIQTVRPVAQFSGALLGVLLVWLLSKFPLEQ